MNDSSIEVRSWKEFSEAGLLWYVNRILHVFGWVLVCKPGGDGGEPARVYPARCDFIGFPEEVDKENKAKLRSHLKREL